MEPNVLCERVREHAEQYSRHGLNPFPPELLDHVLACESCQCVQEASAWGATLCRVLPLTREDLERLPGSEAEPLAFKLVNRLFLFRRLVFEHAPAVLVWRQFLALLRVIIRARKRGLADGVLEILPEVLFPVLFAGANDTGKERLQVCWQQLQ